METDEESTEMPKIRDFHGNSVDPRTGRIVRNDPNSIFFAPSRSEEDRYVRLDSGEINTVPEMLERVRQLGGRPKQVTLLVTPSPSSLAAPVTRPPSRNSFETDAEDLYEISGGNTFRSTCGHCWQVRERKERPRGFTLQEIHDAAKAECDTCNVLQRSVRHFGDIVFGPTYKFDKVRIEQRELSGGIFKTGLLSNMNKVLVHFDDHGGETFELDFQDSDHLGFRGQLPSTHQLIEDTSSKEAVGLIKDWLETCQNTHLDCRIAPRSPLPKRVLEVLKDGVRLVNSDGELGTYLTLSHCWGTTKFVSLTSANHAAMERAVSWSNLSRTFKDAIILTRNLGFRYLWIDSLCIVQDSKQDWELHASKMADIYTKSFLTISASRGENGDRGLFSRRTQEPLKLVYSDLEQVRDPLIWQPYRTSGKDRDGCVRNFAVLMRRPHGLYENKKPKEPLLKRAWVFQEQILSPRLIHFASGELYFECKSHVACECKGWEKRTDSSQWETRWGRAHSVLLSRSRTDFKSPFTPEQEFEAYRTLVESYTQLNITQELDRLPALSGVTFGRSDDYLAGMWKSLLVESLHWCPSPTTTNGAIARRPRVWRGPTWSWVSMECPIRHVETEFGEQERDTQLVANILDASCVPEGLDPRGRVSNAYLRIQSPVAEARVTEIGFCSRNLEWNPLHVTIGPFSEVIEPSQNLWEMPEQHCTFATLQQGTMSEQCFLDVPLALCRSQPAEVVVGDWVGLLLISSTTALVLKMAAAKPGAYVRVGYFKPRETGWRFFNPSEGLVLL